MSRTSRIMSAQTHASFLNAGEMLARAQKLADETTAAAQAGYQQACERGYQAGIAQARQQSTHENIALNLQRSRSLAALEPKISAIVLQTLRQMLGNIDHGEQVCLLVHEALSRLGKLHGEITLYVHPDITTQIASRMQQWNAVHHEVNLTTIADPDRDIDSCRVVCVSGSVEGGLQQQLAAIESALHQNDAKITQSNES